jgi:hypothetical protein
MRCGDWAGTFKDFVEKFARGKTNILRALTVRTALAVDTLHDKVDHILHIMEDAFNNPPSKEERELLDAVNRAGGVQKLLASEKEFKNLCATVSGSGGATDKPSKDEVRQKEKEAGETWDEIKRPLHKILGDHRMIFERKLEVQTRVLTSTIRQSETNVIRALTVGPYVYIDHPVRALHSSLFPVPMSA